MLPVGLMAMFAVPLNGGIQALFPAGFLNPAQGSKLLVTDEVAPAISTTGFTACGPTKESISFSMRDQAASC